MSVFELPTVPPYRTAFITHLQRMGDFCLIKLNVLKIFNKSMAASETCDHAFIFFSLNSLFENQT